MKRKEKILKKQSAAQKKQRLDTNADAGVNVEPGGSEEAEAKSKPGAWSGESWKSNPKLIKNRKSCFRLQSKESTAHTLVLTIQDLVQRQQMSLQLREIRL